MHHLCIPRRSQFGVTFEARLDLLGSAETGAVLQLRRSHLRRVTSFHRDEDRPEESGFTSNRAASSDLTTVAACLGPMRSAPRS